MESTFELFILTSHKTIAQNNLQQKRNLDVAKQPNEEHVQYCRALFSRSLIARKQRENKALPNIKEYKDGSLAEFSVLRVLACDLPHTAHAPTSGKCTAKFLFDKIELDWKVEKFRTKTVILKSIYGRFVCCSHFFKSVQKLIL